MKVICNKTNNTEKDIANGNMNVKVEVSVKELLSGRRTEVKKLLLFLLKNYCIEV